MEFEIFKSKTALKICTGKVQKLYTKMSDNLSHSQTQGY